MPLQKLFDIGVVCFYNRTDITLGPIPQCHCKSSLTLGSFVFIIWLILEATIITTVMKAYLVIVLEDKDKVQHQLINHHQPSSIIINHHQWSSMIINDHQWSSMIINHHQWSSIIINQGMDFHNFFDISVFEEEEEDWSKLPFLYQSWEAPNFGPRRPFEVFKKRKMIRIEFPKFLAWFQTPQTKHKYTNTQIRKDKYTITRITPFWNEVSYFPKQFILTNRWHTVHFQCSAVLWTSSSSPSSSPSPWHCDAVQWHQYHHHHPINVCQIVVGQSPNVLTKTSSHDWSNVLSEIFSPLFLIRGGGGDEKSLEKLESGTGVRKKLKILAWVRLVIVFFYI